MAISAHVVHGMPMAATSIEEYAATRKASSFSRSDWPIVPSRPPSPASPPKWSAGSPAPSASVACTASSSAGRGVALHPSFNPRVAHPAAFLQLCVGHSCLVFQLLHANHIPKALFDFLGSPKLCFVGWASSMIWRNCWRGGIGVHRWVDLWSLAPDKLGSKELKSAGLKKLAEVALGAGGGQTQEDEDEQVGSAMTSL